MLKLEYFYYVVEISKVGSINQAAQNLFISQPYLSSSLKKIEDTLEIKIFNRTNKGVKLTDAGKEFINYSNEIIGLIDKSNNLKKKYTYQNQKLSITSMPSFTMLDLFHNFRDLSEDKYKFCEISYEEVPNTFIPEKVMKGETDIGIIYTTSTEHAIEVKKFEKMHLNFVPLVEESLCAIVSTHNLLYDQDKVTLKELKDLDFLVESIKLSKNSSLVENNHFPEIFKSKNKHSLKFNNNRSMLYYLTKRSDCFCIGQKSLNLTNPLVESKSLKYIPIIDLKVHLTTGYLTNENAKSSHIEEDFIDFLENFFLENKESEKNYKIFYNLNSLLI